MKTFCSLSVCRFLLFALCTVFTFSATARDIEPKPLHYELPGWFKQTFL